MLSFCLSTSDLFTFLFDYLSAEQHVSLREAAGAWQIVLFAESIQYR